MEWNVIAQWAHDIRNTLGTVALYLESLEHSCQRNRPDVLARSNTLLSKATRMCSDLLNQAAQNGMKAGRQRFDVMQSIEEVLDFVVPIVPAATTLSLSGTGPVYAMANRQDVFRILFNLIHNAICVARAEGTMRRIALSLEQRAEAVIIRIADDGPGLPEDIKRRLFVPPRSTRDGNGYGLWISRELAERNGAILKLENCVEGTEFTLELQGGDSDMLSRPGCRASDLGMSGAI